MQLDKTRISIRERSYFDVLDLATRVIRAGGWPLAAALAVGVAPMMLLDAWLLARVREADFEPGFPLRYMLLTVFLVVWQVPLATAPATLYLGQVLFDERPRFGGIARHFWESLPQLLLYQGLFRFLFIGRPYLNEVILLERNPMRAVRSTAFRRKEPPGTIRQEGRGTTNGKSTLGRSRTLHRGLSGDLMARALGSGAVAALLIGAIWGSMYMFRSMLVGDWAWDDVLGTFYFPLAVWIVASYFAVARFLFYLDFRIRREGWEVELLLRAERARLAKQLRVES